MIAVTKKRHYLWGADAQCKAANRRACLLHKLAASVLRNLGLSHSQAPLSPMGYYERLPRRDQFAQQGSPALALDHCPQGNPDLERLCPLPLYPAAPACYRAAFSGHCELSYGVHTAD